LNISGLIRSVMGELQASEPKALELKVGEVVKGMVLQLLSETDAIINIGGVQVRAKLETPLKQGEVTLLQVQPDNNSGQVVLKPLGASGVQIAEGSLAEVLKNIGLPDTATNRQIIQTLHQSGVSLTKGNVQAFAQLQSQIPASVPLEEWISSAVVAFQKGIPLTSETVTAVRQAINGPAFHETLQELEGQMTKLLTDHPALSTTTKSAIDTFKSIVALVKEASSGLVPQTSTQLSDGEIDTLLTAVKSAGSQQTASQAVGISAREVVTDNPIGAKLLVTTNPSNSGSTNQPSSTQQPTSSNDMAPARASAMATSVPLGSQATTINSLQGTILGGAEAEGMNANSSKASANMTNTDQASNQSSKLISGQTQAQTPLAPSNLASLENSSHTGGSTLAAVNSNVQQPAINRAEAPLDNVPKAANPTVGIDNKQAPLTTSMGASNTSALTNALTNTDNAPTARELPPRANISNTASTDASLKVAPSNKQITDNVASTNPIKDTAVRTDATNASSTREVSPVSTGNTAPNEGEHWISKLIKAVGVEHEHTILKLPERIVLDGQFQAAGGLLDKDPLTPNNPLQEQMKSVDTLKGALLMLVQSDDTPTALKETAQQAIQQITGQQLLLNIDRSSMFSNITLFIPLINANGEQTAAIHIQSRKGARGEIDSNNCRLVFDLRMKALGDTMVDVQVVDRIVSLRILNDQPFIQQLLESHREEIAAGLSTVGYQFISLKCGPYPEKGQPVEESTAGSMKQDANLSTQLQGMYGRKPYKGMDLRV
jgi:hypothetical protein